MIGFSYVEEWTLWLERDESLKPYKFIKREWVAEGKLMYTILSLSSI